jgi:presenilin-like A22 family membrane protease
LSNSDSEDLERKLGFANILLVAGTALFVQVSTLVLATPFVPVYSELPSYEPAGQEGAGPILNSVILIAMAAFATIVMLVLIKLRRESLLKGVLGILIAVGSISISYTVSWVWLSYVIEDSSLPALILGAVFSATVFVVTVRPKFKTLNLIVSLLMAILFATSFAIFLKPPTSLVLPVAFAIYDIYAVFAGPLKALLSQKEGIVDSFAPLLVNIGGIHIGLGDFIFYGMLPATALLLSGWYASAMVSGIILAGLGATLLLLKRFKMFPGLPIPLIIGTVALAAVLYL